VLLATVLLAGLCGVGSQKAVAGVAALKWSLAAGVIAALVVFGSCRWCFFHTTLRDVVTTSPGLVDAVYRAVHAAGAQRQQTWGFKLLSWIGLLMLRLLWVLHMIAAVVGGQVVYVNYAIDSYAATYIAALHFEVLLALVCAVGAWAWLPLDWATSAGVEIGVVVIGFWSLVFIVILSRLQTTAQWYNELNRGYKLVLCSPAVLDACYLIVHACAWWLELAILLFVFDCCAGPGLVCYGCLGKWPWQIALDAEETAQLALQQAALNQEALNQDALNQEALNQEEWVVI
jgi:hypothetical protein